MGKSAAPAPAAPQQPVAATDQADKPAAEGDRQQIRRAGSGSAGDVISPSGAADPLNGGKQINAGAAGSASLMG